MPSDLSTSRSPFWPSVCFGGGLLLGVVLVNAFVSVQERSTGGKESQESTASDELTHVATLTPNPDWSPEEVVHRQMEALVTSNRDPSAIADCFVLASPSNRFVTGPLDRFAAMVAGPDYRPLIEARTYSVGEAIVRDRLAAILVSLMTHEGEPFAFRFLLSQQTGEPTIGNPSPTGEYRDCWMTDGVSRVMPPPKPSRLEGSGA